MNIVKKFKDYFNTKPIESKREEDPQEKSRRLHRETIDKLDIIKEDISDIFYEFQDIGAEITISKISSENANKKYYGHLIVEIKFEKKDIEDIDSNFQFELKRYLVETAFRMKEIPGAEIENAIYKSKYQRKNGVYPSDPVERGDTIYMPTWWGTPEITVNRNEYHEFKIGMWTKKDSNDFSKLLFLKIYIYTKPICVE